MRTLMFTLALVALSPALARAETVWQTDYTVAQEEAASSQKPLVVVFGPGANGWQLLGGGSLPEKASQTLAQSYVCCFVDTATPQGRDLARKFEISGSLGLVISDKTGNHMAFWHQGTLTADALSGYLNRYADPDRPLVTTETNPARPPVSFYPPTGTSVGTIQFAPAAGPVCRT